MIKILVYHSKVAIQIEVNNIKQKIPITYHIYEWINNNVKLILGGLDNFQKSLSSKIANIRIFSSYAI